MLFQGLCFSYFRFESEYHELVDNIVEQLVVFFFLYLLLFIRARLLRLEQQLLSLHIKGLKRESVDLQSQLFVIVYCLCVEIVAFF